MDSGTPTAIILRATAMIKTGSHSFAKLATSATLNP